jgi:hypothetical protein
MKLERAKQKIREAITSLAGYGLDVWSSVGPGVQLALVEAIAALPSEERFRDRELIVAVCHAVLAPDIEGTSWSADALTIRSGLVPATKDVQAVREKAISILFDLFRLAPSEDDRRKILAALHQAEHASGRVETSDDLLALTLANATQIVEFFEDASKSLSYEFMATLEHDYLWEYRRARGVQSSSARESCHDAARKLMTAIEKLRDTINQDKAFVRFKVLVGFESVFPFQWEEKTDDYSRQQKYRADEAAKWIDEITEENEVEWFMLIERVASVRSNDLAMFPPFGAFLKQLSVAKPQVVEHLVEVASEDVMRFLPSILSGLRQSGDTNVYEREIERNLRQGTNLPGLVRFLRHERPSVSIAERTLLRAIEKENDIAVAECLIMSMESKAENVPPKERFFEPAIVYLNRRQVYWWVRATWIPSEASSFFETLSDRDARRLMPAMVQAPNVDYSIEQILIQIGKRRPALVWEYFASRLDHKAEGIDRYEPIPHNFHGLEKELSQHAKSAIDFGLGSFRRTSQLFRFRGGRLLSAAFPELPPNFIQELEDLADRGTQEDAEFILAILENYRGEEAIHEVLKRIVARFSQNESIRHGVIISIEAMGVVHGELGFAQAFRSRLASVEKWLDDPRPEVRAFVESYIPRLQRRIADEQRRAEGRQALHRLAYDQDSKQ